jgi:hypothetical protein
MSQMAEQLGFMGAPDTNLKSCSLEKCVLLPVCGRKGGLANVPRLVRALDSLVVVLSCTFGTLAAQDVDPTRNAFVATQDPLGESVTKVTYLEQNWSPDQNVQFYFTSQGSQIVPYDWFLALEQPDSAALLRDNQNILKYRYLAQNPGPLNPDGLPVGFVAGKGTGRSWLGLTCAACHTAEVRLGTTAYRIDGGPTGGDVQAFLTDLTRSLQQTQSDPAKFERFAAKILGSINSPANQAELKAQLGIVIPARVGYNLRNFPGYDATDNAVTAPSRYARLDAVGAIINEVYYHAVKTADLSSPVVVRRSVTRFSGTRPSTTWYNGWASPKTAARSTSSPCRATSAKCSASSPISRFPMIRHC